MRRILIGVACGLLGAYLVFPVVSASATTPTSTTVSTSTATMKTSTGILVKVKVTGFRASSTGPDHLTVNVWRSTSAGTESHVWTFSLTTSSVSFSSSTGKGTVTTATKQIGAFGDVKLALTRTSPASNVACVSGSETSTPVAVKGILHFVPGGTWGSFGSSTVSFTFPSGNFVLLDTGCTHAATSQPCFGLTMWASQSVPVKAKSGTVIGNEFVTGAKEFVSGKAVGVVNGHRSLKLASPAAATRTDTFRVPAPVPAGPTTTSPYTETATTKSGTLASGSAKVKGTTTPVVSSLVTCKTSTGTGTERVKTYPKVLYSTPSIGKLTVHSSIGGNIVVPSGSGTNYGRLEVFFHT